MDSGDGPVRRVFAVVLSAVLCVCALVSRAQVTPDRITGTIDDKQVITLGGNVHPLEQARFDRGAAPGSTLTGRLRLVFERSGAQQQALTQFLGDVQNPASGVNHKWMTPAEYGAKFGISNTDRWPAPPRLVGSAAMDRGSGVRRRRLGLGWRRRHRDHAGRLQSYRHREGCRNGEVAVGNIRDPDRELVTRWGQTHPGRKNETRRGRGRRRWWLPGMPSVRSPRKPV